MWLCLPTSSRCVSRKCHQHATEKRPLFKASQTHAASPQCSSILWRSGRRRLRAGRPSRRSKRRPTRASARRRAPSRPWPERACECWRVCAPQACEPSGEQVEETPVLLGCQAAAAVRVLCMGCGAGLSARHGHAAAPGRWLPFVSAAHLPLPTPLLHRGLLTLSWLLFRPTLAATPRRWKE